MDLDEAWNSGVYLPTPGANDPPTGYSDFDRTKHPCNDSKFDYALLICNVNRVRDDEFIVCLNGYELGPIAELGVDACGGRFFATSQEIVDVIKRGQDDPDCPQFQGLTICCITNTDAVTIVDKKPFMADARIVNVDPDGNPVVTKNFFDLFMRNTKDNFHNNFGEFVIWRMSKYKSGGKELESLCELGRGNYAARSGEDFGPHDFGEQPLCCDPKLYPSYCCTVGGIIQCDPEKGTPGAEPADECSEDYYPPPEPPEPPPPEPPFTPPICAGYCYYTWSQSDYKWILEESISYCCKDPDNPLTGDDCDPYDPNDTGRECNCCPPVNPGLSDGDVMFGVCDDVSVACALPPEPPEPPEPTPDPPPPDPPSINCWYEWTGSDWYFRSDVSFCEQTCCEPTGTGSEIGELVLGTCQESCPEPPPPTTPTCEGGCVYKWELDSSDPDGGYWKLVDLASDCTCFCCPPLHIGNDGDIYIGTCQDDSCPDPPSPPPPKDPPSPCGWCAYIWDGTQWTLDTVLTGCFEPCKCSEPPYDGTFDTEMANGSCSEPPSEPPDDTNVCPDGTANQGQNIPDGETEEWCHTSSEPDDDDDDDDDDLPTSPVCPNAKCAWLFNMDTWSWELIVGCPFDCPGHSCNPPAPLPLDVDISSPDFTPSADTPCFPP